MIPKPILTPPTAGDSVVTNIYGENLARLQSVKAQYDPNNVFHKMHPIPLFTGEKLKK
jgi:FAD/FMN-containing dehydrogenase